MLTSNCRRGLWGMVPVAVGLAVFWGTAGARSQDVINQPTGIVGPTVMMNARLNGAIQVVDVRSEGGRKIPEAVRGEKALNVAGNKPLFLIGSVAEASEWAKERRVERYAVVPPRMIEFEHEAGLPQLSPEKAKENGWPLFDVSEAEEFAGLRIPGSRRLDYSEFRLGSLKGLPKGKPFVVACRVGHRSQLVAKELRGLGYKAYNLDGGLWEWECRGLPMFREKN